MKFNFFCIEIQRKNLRKNVGPVCLIELGNGGIRGECAFCSSPFIVLRTRAANVEGVASSSFCVISIAKYLLTATGSKCRKSYLPRRTPSWTRCTIVQAVRTQAAVSVCALFIPVHTNGRTRGLERCLENLRTVLLFLWNKPLSFTGKRSGKRRGRGLWDSQPGVCWRPFSSGGALSFYCLLCFILSSSFILLERHEPPHVLEIGPDKKKVLSFDLQHDLSSVRSVTRSFFFTLCLRVLLRVACLGVAQLCVVRMDDFAADSALTNLWFL